jgi:Rod binding domain-containing protein
MIKPLALISAPDQTRAAAGTPKANSPEADAAQQFEQIFLRKMLSQLMETTKMGGKSQMAGSGVYDSMVVDALAGSISASGGLGLAAVIQKRLEAHPAAANAISATLPENAQPPAQRLDQILKIHSSADPSDRLFQPEAQHLDPKVLRRTR